MTVIAVSAGLAAWYVGHVGEEIVSVLESHHLYMHQEVELIVNVLKFNGKAMRDDADRICGVLYEIKAQLEKH